MLVTLKAYLISHFLGRGSFRPIQSSLTKAAVSRPIVPKVLPTQATNHLSSKCPLKDNGSLWVPYFLEL